MNNHAFISYSHSDCGYIAPAIQKALENIGKPWYKLTRNLNVFRDETNLSASPELWNSIVAALDNSDNFILLASPIAKTSYWVNKEIEYWFSKERSGKLYIVHTKGHIAWDAVANDFNWEKTNCLPPCLSGKFKQEPRLAMVSEFVSDNSINYKDAGFTSELTKVIAGIMGKLPREVASAELRRNRNIRTAIASGSIIFTVLLFGLFALYQISNNNKRSSVANNLIAKGYAIMGTDINKALLYYAYAYEKNNDSSTLKILKRFYFQNSLIDSNRQSVDTINLFYSTIDTAESDMISSRHDTDIASSIRYELKNRSLSFFKGNTLFLPPVQLSEDFENIINNPELRLTISEFIVSSDNTHAFIKLEYGHFIQRFIVDMHTANIIHIFDLESGKYETGFRTNAFAVHFDVSGRYYIIGFENGGLQMHFLNEYDSLYNVRNYVALNSEDHYTFPVTAIYSYKKLIFVGYEDGAFAIYENTEARYSGNPYGNFLTLIRRIKLGSCRRTDDYFYDCSINGISFEPKTKTVFIQSLGGNVYKMKLNKGLTFKDFSPQNIINELKIDDLSKDEKIIITK